MMHFNFIHPYIINSVQWKEVVVFVTLTLVMLQKLNTVLAQFFFVILADKVGKDAEQKARKNTKRPMLRYFLITFSMNRPVNSVVY